MDATIPLSVAFTAGIVSFLAPCVLPIIPGFLAYLAGSSVGEAGAQRREIFFNSVFFVLGFSLVFAALGVLLNTLLQTAAYGVRVWLSRAGGALVILFGLSLTGLIRVPILESEHRLRVGVRFRSRYLTSFLFGLAFAAGWTPCVGPALGAILGLAVTAPAAAFSLLLAYALGLGMPFLLVGLFTAQAARLINRYARILNYIKIGFGAILIILGILVFTSNLSLIANWEFLNRWLLR